MPAFEDQSSLLFADKRFIIKAKPSEIQLLTFNSETKNITIAITHKSNDLYTAVNRTFPFSGQDNTDNSLRLHREDNGDPQRGYICPFQYTEQESSYIYICRPYP